MPACRPMMVTSSDAVSLLGGIICLPLPPPRPMAGRLAGGSSSVPASLHSTHCRLDCRSWRMLCCHVAMFHLWRMLCRRSSSLADALPPWSYFSVDASPLIGASCLLSWHLWRQYILFLQVQLFGWQVWSALLFLALAVCVFVCTFLQYFSVFSPLWSCIGQVLFGHIKSVSVTAFFLMKNVLRHGREKKNLHCLHQR